MPGIYENKPTEAELLQVNSLTYDVLHISRNTIAHMSADEQEHLLTRLDRLQARKKLFCTLRKFAGVWKVKHILFDIMGESTELNTEFATLQEAIDFIYTMKKAEPYITAKI